MPSNHSKAVVQLNKLTEKVREIKEQEIEPPYEMSEYEKYVQEKRKCNEEFMKSLDLKKLQNNNGKGGNKNTSKVTTKASEKIGTGTRVDSGELMEKNDECNPKHNSPKQIKSIQSFGGILEHQGGATDYRDENNWMVDYFVSHKKKKFDVVIKRKKQAYNGYILLARWKDFSPSDDTEEPLNHAVQHHKTKVLA
jgi:hypothetical protein